MSANIYEDKCNRNTCGITYWRNDGILGRVGEVRRCEHGRIWQWEREAPSRYGGSLLDVWVPLHWFWDRKRYRAAVAALAGELAS